jgi:hypothetical protein
VKVRVAHAARQRRHAHSGECGSGGGRAAAGALHPHPSEYLRPLDQGGEEAANAKIEAALSGQTIIDSGLTCENVNYGSLASRPGQRSRNSPRPIP